ncbi:hypothetical protein HPB48_005466 [Haemaphysalis longicornis]|uniref:Sulfotransferase domain-containing protein n=1 Tax=Haemaphysalis longicornis TaxID=44386 RepID=A0A9J6H472_HAELO|nr:hypothetical protein HPB48_005466 [Haemaphysalis longicornis]
MTESRKPTFMVVRGTPFADYFLRDRVESAMNYCHREGDVFIVTYVKCGTTWMQHIVYLIQNDGVPPASAVEFYTASPFIEVCGSDCTRWMKRPGAIKTHMPLHLTRYSPDARYIVVIRNPWDVIVSMHHFWFMISAYDYKENFDYSFENFMKGHFESGDYFKFYRDWYKLSGEANVLFIVYEDMKNDPKAAVLRVARFLGADYEARLLADGGKILDAVLKYSSVEEMANYTNRMIHDFYEAEFPFHGEEYRGWRHLHEVVHKGAGASADKINYVRKGTVGDWKNHFSSEQVKRLSEKFREETRGSGIANLWPDLGLQG